MKDMRANMLEYALTLHEIQGDSRRAARAVRGRHRSNIS